MREFPSVRLTIVRDAVARFTSFSRHFSHQTQQQQDDDDEIAYFTVR